MNRHTRHRPGRRARLPAALLSVVAAGLALSGHQAAAQATAEPCGSLSNAYGPYDYTNPVHRRENLRIVEDYHLNDDVLALRRGMTAETPLGDISYTLRAFPNHHLALDAMARYHRRHSTEQFSNGRYSIGCWFDRARRFNPRDGNVRLLYGIHLMLTSRHEDALEEMEQALRLMPNSAEVHYNLGLLHVGTGNLDVAEEHARRAYDLGYPLPGLRDKLRDAGRWDN